MKHIIKCMAKDCYIKIEIELKRTWYLDNNNKRIYTYGRENQLSFCLKHTEEFKIGLQEMKENISKENIQKILNKIINNYINLSKNLNEITDKHKKRTLKIIRKMIIYGRWWKYDKR